MRPECRECTPARYLAWLRRRCVPTRSRCHARRPDKGTWQDRALKVADKLGSPRPSKLRMGAQWTLRATSG
eukprot:15434657-Alexandrium_andersonii.AAC.1